MDPRSDIIDKHLLESIIEVVSEKAPLISGMILNVGSTSQLKDISKLNIISIKVVAVLIILCCSAH